MCRQTEATGSGHPRKARVTWTPQSPLIYGSLAPVSFSTTGDVIPSCSHNAAHVPTCSNYAIATSSSHLSGPQRRPPHTRSQKSSILQLRATFGNPEGTWNGANATSPTSSRAHSGTRKRSPKRLTPIIAGGRLRAVHACAAGVNCSRHKETVPYRCSRKHPTRSSIRERI